MYQNRLDTIVNIIELQNSRLNNNVIETKSIMLLEYEIVKFKDKDDLVL